MNAGRSLGRVDQRSQNYVLRCNISRRALGTLVSTASVGDTEQGGNEGSLLGYAVDGNGGNRPL